MQPRTLLQPRTKNCVPTSPCSTDFSSSLNRRSAVPAALRDSRHEAGFWELTQRVCRGHSLEAYILDQEF